MLNTRFIRIEDICPLHRDSGKCCFEMPKCSYNNIIWNSFINSGYNIYLHINYLYVDTAIDIPLTGECYFCSIDMC
jgi:hypothetical protein